MREIITQAPIQTRENTTMKLERLFPLLVAESLNRINEYIDGEDNPRVDTWNTVGSKIDTLFKDSESELTRYDYGTKQIEQRFIYFLQGSKHMFLRN